MDGGFKSPKVAKHVSIGQNIKHKVSISTNFGHEELGSEPSTAFLWTAVLDTSPVMFSKFSELLANARVLYFLYFLHLYLQNKKK